LDVGISADLCDGVTERRNYWSAAAGLFFLYIKKATFLPIQRFPRMLLFCMSKVPELFDTVLLVLRKKPVITLHWYHHGALRKKLFQKSYPFFLITPRCFCRLHTIHRMVVVQRR
jgi:hypothetical protein